MTPPCSNQNIALVAHLLGLGIGVTVIIGLVPAALALLRTVI